MGAPKQKWTAEEEAALKAGVVKHGAGKWRTILTDAEFSSVLCLRSNVDLKDKWRNINVTAIWGSRQKAKLALWNYKPNPNPESDQLPLSTLVQNEEEIVDGAEPVNDATLVIDTKPVDHITNEKKRKVNPKESNVRLDKLILQAIANLKDPRGSDRAAISSYIEGKFNPLANGNGHEQYWTPPDLKRLLSSKLKYMATTGKLLKLKHRYKIPPSSKALEKRRNISMLPLNNGAQKGSSVNVLTESRVNEELVKMRSMTAHEAAAAAAQAVAEAEAAMEAAEEAEREAEAAEAEAEAAQIFAKAAMKAFKCGLRIW